MGYELNGVYNLIELAEGEGFEPSVQVLSYNGLKNGSSLAALTRFKDFDVAFAASPQSGLA